MHTLIFVPGIMGTSLFSRDGEVVWPPRPIEFLKGYARIEKLLADDLRVGEIIETVVCKDVYGSLLAQFAELGFGVDDAKRRLELFAYDWRLDLETTADRLRERLRQLSDDGASTMTIVAHSMGGLISRMVLENTTDADAAWLSKVDTFVALAVPQTGAPLALARVLGLDSALGISAADFKKLAGDSRYPSGYQLLPNPGEDTLWDQSQGKLETYDIFDPRVAERLGLDPALLERKKVVHESLDLARKPKPVRYVHFAGTGHNTVTRVNIVGSSDGDLALHDFRVTRTPSAGDGTVPLISALDGAFQHQTVINEHAGVFRGTPFKRVFFRLFGIDLGVAVKGQPKRAVVNLSVPEPVIGQDEGFDALLSIDDHPGRITGDVILESLDGQGGVTERSVLASIDRTLDEDSFHLLHVEGLSSPGFYRITFDGSADVRAVAEFAVVRRN